MSKPSPFRDCLKCEQPVHARSKVCKACGAASPFAKAEDAPEPAPPPDTLTMDHVEAAKEMLRQNDPPELRVIDSTADDFNPSQETVGAFLHDLSAVERAEEADRTAALEAINGPHVFMQKHSTMIGNTMAHFHQGQVVSDFALLQALKSQPGTPMVPFAQAPGMVCCPQCKNVFKPMAALPTPRRFVG